MKIFILISILFYISLVASKVTLLKKSKTRGLNTETVSLEFEYLGTCKQFRDHDLATVRISSHNNGDCLPLKPLNKKKNDFVDPDLDFPDVDDLHAHYFCTDKEGPRALVHFVEIFKDDETVPVDNFILSFVPSAPFKAVTKNIVFTRRPSCSAEPDICNVGQQFVTSCFPNVIQLGVIMKRGQNFVDHAFVINKDRVYVTLEKNSPALCNIGDACCPYIDTGDFGMCPYQTNDDVFPFIEDYELHTSDKDVEKTQDPGLINQIDEDLINSDYPNVKTVINKKPYPTFKPHDTFVEQNVAPIKDNFPLDVTFEDQYNDKKRPLFSFNNKKVKPGHSKSKQGNNRPNSGNNQKAGHKNQNEGNKNAKAGHKSQNAVHTNANPGYNKHQNTIPKPVQEVPYDEEDEQTEQQAFNNPFNLPIEDNNDYEQDNQNDEEEQPKKSFKKPVSNKKKPNSHNNKNKNSQHNTNSQHNANSQHNSHNTKNKPVYGKINPKDQKNNSKKIQSEQEETTNEDELENDTKIIGGKHAHSKIGGLNMQVADKSKLIHIGPQKKEELKVTQTQDQTPKNENPKEKIETTEKKIETN